MFVMAKIAVVNPDICYGQDRCGDLEPKSSPPHVIKSRPKICICHVCFESHIAMYLAVVTLPFGLVCFLPT